MLVAKAVLLLTHVTSSTCGCHNQCLLSDKRLQHTLQKMEVEQVKLYDAGRKRGRSETSECQEAEPDQR